MEFASHCFMGTYWRCRCEFHPRSAFSCMFGPMAISLDMFGLLGVYLVLFFSIGRGHSPDQVCDFDGIHLLHRWVKMKGAV